MGHSTERGDVAREVVELLLWSALAISLVVAVFCCVSQIVCAFLFRGNGSFDYFTEKMGLWSLMTTAVVGIIIVVFYGVIAVFFPVNSGTIVDKTHTEARDEQVPICLTVGENPCGTMIFNTVHHPECYGVVISDGEHKDTKCLPEQEWNALNVGEHYTYTG